jgi:hypothetical protein
MMYLLSGVGLHYNEKANDPGAQTERRGGAGPVSVLLRGWDSPAAFSNSADFCRTVLQTVLSFAGRFAEPSYKSRDTNRLAQL